MSAPRIGGSRSGAQGGRQRLSAEERREQLFTANMTVVAQLGYANATLTEIARRAGIAKGLLWHYFTDRDDLMVKTVSHLAERIRDAVVADIDTAAGVPDVIRSVLLSTARLTRTHAAELEAIDQIVHNLRTAEGQQKITMQAYDATYADHERLITRGQADGTIRPGDTRVMAVAYQGVIDALIAYLQDHPDRDPEAEAHAMADVLLSGLVLP